LEEQIQHYVLMCCNLIWDFQLGILMCVPAQKYSMINLTSGNFSKNP